MAETNEELTISVIIPAYNERATILQILERVCRIENLLEVIVVDDGSTDGTPDRVRTVSDRRIKLICQPVNRGKTAAVLRGIREVSGDITVFQDADLEYDPEEIGILIEPILSNKADVAYGSRFLVRRATRVLYFYHYLANRMLTILSNTLTNVNMTDIETCYKAFRTPLIKGMHLTSSGFGMEVEITAMITKTRARIFEVPISYYGRTYEEGKKIGKMDGVAALWYIVFYNLIAPSMPKRRRYVEQANRFLAQVCNESFDLEAPPEAAPEISKRQLLVDAARK